MRYTLSFLQPHEQFIGVRVQLRAKAGKLQLSLPHWRPGRYELQQYARNITNVKAVDNNNQILTVKKSATHVWEIEVKQESQITFTYDYFANQLDAGGSYFDENWIYVNGINLFMYQADRIEDACELTLELPEGYELAGGLSGMDMPASLTNFHQLVDLPFFAAKDLIHHRFLVNGVPNHLWFMGDCKPDLERMEQDISAYTRAQLKLFGHFPTDEYHYLFLILPYRYRHGVEHYNSTVIAMGPGHQLMQKEMYKSFLEISSHELFHTWNVKALRPKDMWPYAYERENYSRLHYVTEGVTTYYGDLMLWKGGVWNLAQWVNSINGELRRHHQMGGHPFTSLEDASFDSWVNGYNNDGVPNRRISFYTKGYLIAMLTDFQIRYHSNNEYSLDEVMWDMYHNIARNGLAYSREDYWSCVEKYAGTDLSAFFSDYISGVTDLKAELQRLGDYYGLQLGMNTFENPDESWWGVKTSSSKNGNVVIDNILQTSPAFKAGMHKGDEIISVNGRKIENNWNELLTYFSDADQLEIHFFHLKQLKSAILQPGFKNLTYIPQFYILIEASEEQLQNRTIWHQIKTGRGVKSK